MAPVLPNVRPKAPAQSIVTRSGANYRFTVLTEGLLRYEYSADGAFEDRASTFAINRDLPTPPYRVSEREDGLHIITSKFHLTLTGIPFTASSLTAQVLGGVSDWKSRWRFGEPAENLGGTARTLDDVDGRMPLDPGVLARYGYASIDDSSSMLFQCDWVANRIPDRIDGYLFAHGKDFRAGIRDFYAVSGPTPLLPRWALGNWWSRFHPYSEKDYLELMDKFASEKIPLSVAVIDVDWHLITDERVQATGSSGWTGYTWNEKLFPDPVRFMDALHERGLKVTLNDHPADGIYSFEDSYKTLAKVLRHDTSNEDPIPFDPSSREFIQAFFEIVRRPIEHQGLDFWWCDWQQGTHSRVTGIDPLWILNHFSFLDNSINKRPMHFSRFAGPGSHRYPIGFSGDSIVSWDSLRFQPEFTNTAANIGYGWWSHDIGGHRDGKRDEELETRWVQYGVFSPILRLHSSTGLWTNKEPWTFSIEHSQAQSSFLRFRHRLLPYLYSMNVRATEGTPLCTPMYWHHTQDAAFTVPNQYYFGSELIIVPVTEPRTIETRRARVRGWLPPGRFVDIFTETVYDGDRYVWLNRTIDEYPVFAPEGAILTLDAKESGNSCDNTTDFEVLVVVGKDGDFDIFEDDGGPVNGLKTRKTRITFKQEEGRLEISPTEMVDGLPIARKWTLRFLAFSSEAPITCEVDGNSHPVTSERIRNSTKLVLGSVHAASPVVVVLGSGTRLACHPAHMQLRSTINDAQIDFSLKEEIWSALEPGMSRPGQAARLLSLPLRKELIDALIEIVLAEA